MAPDPPPEPFPRPDMALGSALRGVPLRVDRLVLRVAYAYDALPFDVFQHLRSALAGDHNIAQALATAHEVVAALPDEDLAYLLARLLVCTSDTID